jgi:hypothetical protein
MPRQVEQSTSMRALSSDRLQPAGADRFRAALWSTRLTMAAFALSAGWLLFSALRPLPTPDAVAAPTPPALPTEADHEPTLAQREALLGQLAASGNIFAPDHRPWKTATASRGGGASKSSNENDPGANRAKPATSSSTIASAAAAGRPVRYEDIPIEKKPAIGVSKELKNLRLRGVYRYKGVPVAMIGSVHQTNRSGAEPRRVGDTFGEASWKVVAIDDIGKRVILNLASVNVELRMYDDENVVAQVGTRGRLAVALPRNPSVVVHTQTPEQIRQDLARAGLSNAEIDALLSLSEAPALASATKPIKPRAQVSPSLGSAPPGIAELLKMMVSGTAPSGMTPTLPQVQPPQPAPSPQSPAPSGG